MSLPKVVAVDADKCQNCHACITACPSKFCNDGSGNHVKINDDLCIGCGQCLAACTWGARTIVDDTAEFFNDLNRGVPIVTIIAPGIAASFPHAYLNLNGWFKKQGIAANFDVSFGAELTIKTYLEHISKITFRKNLRSPNNEKNSNPTFSSCINIHCKLHNSTSNSTAD